MTLVRVKMALALALLLYVLITGQVCAASLHIENTVATQDNSEFEVSIILRSSNDEQVAAAQFDLIFNENTLRLPELDGAKAGDSAQAADKNVSYAIVKPGVCRVVVAGFNQNLMDDGTLTVLKFSKVDSDNFKGSLIDLVNGCLADPMGKPVPLESPGVSTSNATVSSWFSGNLMKLFIAIVVVLVPVIAIQKKRSHHVVRPKPKRQTQ